MHEVARDVELVVNRKKQAREEAKRVEPDTFPINNLSADLIEEYDSIWTHDRTLRKRLEAKVGHYLRVKESSIDHHEAGMGVFVSCRRQRIVLPGTLLGLFPGVMCDPHIPRPQTPKASAIRPYLLRWDGWWLDYEKELPYPMPPPGVSFHHHYEMFKLQAELRGDPSAELVEVPP